LRDLVLKFKFGGAMAGVALLREMAWRTYAFHRQRPDGFSGRPDVVTAVPLYRNRLRGRGYNQSLELAKGVAAKLGVRALPGALRKVRRTAPQNELSATERQTNLKDAFAADERMVAGKNVLVVDDVMTTGSTLEEAARVLLRAGACRVEVLALARD
jgi:ComF family protein